jgi:hypothetical protein
MMAGANSGVDPNSNVSARIHSAEGFQLGQGIHTDGYAAADSIQHFFFRYIVAYIENLFRPEAGSKKYMDFSRRHSICMQAFFMNDLQKFQTGIGLGRVIGAVIGVLDEAGHFFAALAQYGFIIYIQRAAELFNQFTRC